MAKSEINLLQELSIKHGFIPLYNFTQESINCSTQFTCHVFCKQLTTYGTGNSKKEAKYNAARNMLSLLTTNDEILLPVHTSSVTNTLQNSAKLDKTSPSCKQSTIDYNYIGLLQEFCQQRQISTKDILYELIYDEGLPHKKIFTTEVSLGSLRERGTAQCKKSSKQEAAKKLLMRLNPDIVNENMLHTKKIVLNKETLENDIRKLGTRILDSAINKDTSSVAKLSENAKSLYLKCTKKVHVSDQEINPLVLKNLHMLFKKNYSNKIPYDMKEKMQIIRDKYNDRPDLMHEIRQDIENLLKVKIQQITLHSVQNHIICLHLLSNPRITQFGMDETKAIAESRAMYNLIDAILIFIN